MAFAPHLAPAAAAPSLGTPHTCAVALPFTADLDSARMHPALSSSESASDSDERSHRLRLTRRSLAKSSVQTNSTPSSSSSRGGKSSSSTLYDELPPSSHAPLAKRPTRLDPATEDTATVTAPSHGPKRSRFAAPPGDKPPSRDRAQLDDYLANKLSSSTSSISSAAPTVGFLPPNPPTAYSHATPLSTSTYRRPVQRAPSLNFGSSAYVPPPPPTAPAPLLAPTVPVVGLSRHAERIQEVFSRLISGPTGVLEHVSRRNELVKQGLVPPTPRGKYELPAVVPIRRTAGTRKSRLDVPRFGARAVTTGAGGLDRGGFKEREEARRRQRELERGAAPEPQEDTPVVPSHPHAPILDVTHEEEEQTADDEAVAGRSGGSLIMQEAQPFMVTEEDTQEEGYSTDDRRESRIQNHVSPPVVVQSSVTTRSPSSFRQSPFARSSPSLKLRSSPSPSAQEVEDGRSVHQGERDEAREIEEIEEREREIEREEERENSRKLGKSLRAISAVLKGDGKPEELLMQMEALVHPDQEEEFETEDEEYRQEDEELEGQDQDEERPLPARVSAWELEARAQRSTVRFAMSDSPLPPRASPTRSVIPPLSYMPSPARSPSTSLRARPTSPDFSDTSAPPSLPGTPEVFHSSPSGRLARESSIGLRKPVIKPLRMSISPDVVGPIISTPAGKRNGSSSRTHEMEVEMPEPMETPLPSPSPSPKSFRSAPQSLPHPSVSAGAKTLLFNSSNASRNAGWDLTERTLQRQGNLSAHHLGTVKGKERVERSWVDDIPAVLSDVRLSDLTKNSQLTRFVQTPAMEGSVASDAHTSSAGSVGPLGMTESVAVLHKDSGVDLQRMMREGEDRIRRLVSLVDVSSKPDRLQAPQIKSQRAYLLYALVAHVVLFYFVKSYVSSSDSQR